MARRGLDWPWNGPGPIPPEPPPGSGQQGRRPGIPASLSGALLVGGQQQHPVDPPFPSRQFFHDVDSHHRAAVFPGRDERLRDLLFSRQGRFEMDLAGPVKHPVALPHHPHEIFRRPELGLDSRSREGKRRPFIVPAEGSQLLLDDLANSHPFLRGKGYGGIFIRADHPGGEQHQRQQTPHRGAEDAGSGGPGKHIRYLMEGLRQEGLGRTAEGRDCPRRGKRRW